MSAGSNPAGVALISDVFLLLETLLHAAFREVIRGEIAGGECLSHLISSWHSHQHKYIKNSTFQVKIAQDFRIGYSTVKISCIQLLAIKSKSSLYDFLQCLGTISALKGKPLIYRSGFPYIVTI